MLKELWLGLECGVLFHGIRPFRIRGQNGRVTRGVALDIVEQCTGVAARRSIAIDANRRASASD